MTLRRAEDVSEPTDRAVDAMISAAVKASNHREDAIRESFNQIKEPPPIGGTVGSFSSYLIRTAKLEEAFRKGVELGLKLANHKP